MSTIKYLPIQKSNKTSKTSPLFAIMAKSIGVRFVLSRSTVQAINKLYYV